MNRIIRKLSSRKLWVAVAGIATGIAMALGVDASDVQAVAGALTAVASVVTYIVAEGKVDATRIGSAVESVKDAMEVVDETH